MNSTCHHWIGLFCIFGTFLFSAFHGYHENKLQPAVVIAFMILLFTGFGFGAALKGIVDLFTK